MKLGIWLGIGIGFGLQNIFNNFISGLIMLFERPIQVGDYAEVGELWAEVEKINVRSTVVQTFDNASVIIPNSEFISQQVKNYSFRDKRMRRNLEVEVAYGSNVDLVEKTLLVIESLWQHPGWRWSRTSKLLSIDRVMPLRWRAKNKRRSFWVKQKGVFEWRGR